MSRRTAAPILFLLLLLTFLAFLLQGYHPGAEDDGVYLSAIQKRLDPTLYPYNSIFFTLQLQATIFDKLIAGSVRVLHLPVAYVCLMWQLLAIFLLLLGCWTILAFCFRSLQARLAGVLAIACLLTLSVAGTALYISDEHLHPRTLATDAILFAIAATQRRRYGRAALLLLLATLLHPIMAMFGIAFCCCFVLCRSGVLPQLWPSPARQPRRIWAAVPLAWLFSPATPAWREALAQHGYYRVTAWTWYEWLGALAPPFLLWALARLGHRRGNAPFALLARTAAVYSVILFALALCMQLPPEFIRLLPLQPMRYLHLTFLMLALLSGAALGEYVLKGRWALWFAVYLPLAGVNAYAQRIRYPATRNLELPWTPPSSDWLRAFAWVRANTPKNAVFAMDPHYLSAQGDDNHSFRALAQRSSLADDEKDAAVATQVPSLASLWLHQHKEQEGWPHWREKDFARLALQSPARWFLVSPSQSKGLVCPFNSASVDVCHLPECASLASHPHCH